MESWRDTAIILNVRGHGENGGVVTLLTQQYGRYAGFVHGAKSSTKRAVLQPGNLVHAQWQARSSENLGTLSLESEIQHASQVMHDLQKLTAVQSACALMTACLPEREKHEALYHGTLAFFDNLDGDVWAELYVLWELAFLKELGFGIDLKRCAAGGNPDTLEYVSPKSGIGVSAEKAAPYKDKLLKIPSFLQGRPALGNEDILDGLKLTAYFIEHRLLADTSYHQLPDARLRLQECFV